MNRILNPSNLPPSGRVTSATHPQGVDIRLTADQLDYLLSRGLALVDDGPAICPDCDIQCIAPDAVPWATGNAPLWSMGDVFQHLTDYPGDPNSTVEDNFTQRLAVLVADMVGFAEDMEDFGVIDTLSGVSECRLRAESVALVHGGRLVKCWADNVMMTFPDVKTANAAAHDLMGECPEHWSIGIGWGDVVLLTDDVWGDEVNRASTLGEDDAGGGQVLLTQAAWSEVFG